MNINLDLTDAVHVSLCKVKNYEWKILELPLISTYAKALIDLLPYFNKAMINFMETVKIT